MMQKVCHPCKGVDVKEGVRAALREAIRKAGNQSKLAKAIGGKVRTGHIYYWLNEGKVPVLHVVRIEETTGVSRTLLCPEWRRVWPDFQAEAAQECPAAA